MIGFEKLLRKLFILVIRDKPLVSDIIFRNGGDKVTWKTGPILSPHPVQQGSAEQRWGLHDIHLRGVSDTWDDNLTVSLDIKRNFRIL